MNDVKRAMNEKGGMLQEDTCLEWKNFNLSICPANTRMFVASSELVFIWLRIVLKYMNYSKFTGFEATKLSDMFAAYKGQTLWQW